MYTFPVLFCPECRYTLPLWFCPVAMNVSALRFEMVAKASDPLLHPAATEHVLAIVLLPIRIPAVQSVHNDTKVEGDVKVYISSALMDGLPPPAAIRARAVL